MNVDVLIDTGSCFTLIDKKVFDRLQNPTSFESHVRHIRGLTDVGKEVVGATCVDVQFAENNVMSLTCHVVSDLTYDILLGRDMLKHVLHTINYVDGVVTLFSTHRRRRLTCDCYVTARQGDDKLTRVMCVSCLSTGKKTSF